MKFGMPTLIETNNIEDCVNICEKLHLDFIELNMNLPQYQVDKIDINKLSQISKEKNIFFTMHLDENINVCDFNQDVANAYIKTLLSTIEIAKQLNIPVLNMHMSKGVYFTLPTKKVYLFNQYRDIYLEKLKAFRDICEKEIGDTNIKICIENSSGYLDFTQEGIELLLQSKVFALTYDIGHNHAIGGADEPFIMKHIDKLIHMHVHDAIGTKNHLIIGKGEIDIREKLNLAKENNCRCVVETKTIEALTESVEILRENYVL